MSESESQARVEPEPPAMQGMDAQALKEAFELFTESSRAMEESYRRLEERMRSMDQELQRKNQELALAKDYLNSILDSMSDGMIAVNTDGVITNFNPAAAAILGYGPSELIGETYRDVFGHQFSIGPGFRARELSAKDGSAVPISESNSPIADSSNSRLGSVKVFQDLREIESLREQVRRKDRLAAIGEMAATVAHEIRNPLGGVRGFANLLQQDIDPSDDRARLVEKIIEGTKNLDRVVNELLEYTRPVELRQERVLCADMVDSAIGYASIDTSRIATKNRVDPKLSITVDQHRMRQVLLNILLNAKQSIEGEGTIVIHAEVHNSFLDLSVKDSGCGIPQERIEHLFSPFFTTKEKGTGLGLAVASKIVEGHGGSLEVTSTEGEGSIFHVRLPLGE
jgi:PAS domain S-box-containing protein